MWQNYRMTMVFFYLLAIILIGIPDHFSGPTRIHCLSPSLGTNAPSELSADEFEEALISFLGINVEDKRHHHIELNGNGHSYKITIPAIAYPHDEPFYFRVEDIFVIDTGSWHLLNDLRGESQNLTARYPYVIWLTGNDDLTNGWGWPNPDILDRDKVPEEYRWLWDDSPLQPYILPPMVGVLISMQEMKDKIKGRIFVDVGSRNGLYANVALKLGARRAILIENQPIKNVFTPWSLDEQYGIQMDDDMLTVNLKVNGNTERATVFRENFIGIPEQDLQEGVVAFNFPGFGSPYENSDGRRNGFSSSLIQDLFRKLGGIRWIIASGGDTRSNEDFLKDVAMLPLKQLFDVRIYLYTYSVGWGRVNPETQVVETGKDRIEVFVETFVYQVTDSVTLEQSV